MSFRQLILTDGELLAYFHPQKIYIEILRNKIQHRLKKINIKATCSNLQKYRKLEKKTRFKVGKKNYRKIIKRMVGEILEAKSNCRFYQQ